MRRLAAEGESGADELLPVFVDDVRTGGTEGWEPFAIEVAVFPEGAVEVRLPLNGGIAWMTIEILLLEVMASLVWGLEDEEDVLIMALEEAAAG